MTAADRLTRMRKAGGTKTPGQAEKSNNHESHKDASLGWQRLAGWSFRIFPGIANRDIEDLMSAMVMVVLFSGKRKHSRSSRSPVALEPSTLATLTVMAASGSRSRPRITSRDEACLCACSSQWREYPAFLKIGLTSE